MRQDLLEEAAERAARHDHAAADEAGHRLAEVEVDPIVLPRLQVRGDRRHRHRRHHVVARHLVRLPVGPALSVAVAVKLLSPSLSDWQITAILERPVGTKPGFDRGCRRCVGMQSSGIVKINNHSEKKVKPMVRIPPERLSKVRPFLVLNT